MLAYYTPTQDTESPLNYQDLINFLPPHQPQQDPSHRNSSFSFSSSSPPSSPPPLVHDDQWMNSFQNPSIRVQKSSPLSAADQDVQQQMLVQHFPGNSWEGGDSLLSPSHFAQASLIRQRLNGGKHHKRASSASSVVSAGPPSPQDNVNIYPHIANGDAANFSPHQFDSLDHFATTRGQQMPKSLPTPVDTPIQNTFAPSDYQQFHSQDAMRRIPQNHSPNHDDDVAAYSYSGPQSVSSVSHHDSPATPQTASYDGDYGEAAKGLQNTGAFNLSTGNAQLNMPHGLVTGGFDDFYHGQLQNLPQQQQQAQMVARAGGMSPFRTSLANRFHAAQLDHVASRASSPAHSIQREKSPFRQGSAYDHAAQMSPMAGQRLGPPQMTPTQFSQQQNLNNNAIMAQQRQRQQSDQPKTVSPKEVELEYHEEDQAPLFPSSQQSQFSLPREESNFSTASNFGQSGQFYTTLPSTNAAGQQFPFIGQQRRQQSNLQSSMVSNAGQPLPDFPAHLASMETTASSESGQDASTPVPAQRSVPIVRPRGTSADVGAYSCTAPGCTQRFGSPAQLQKHRRDAHRQPSPVVSAPAAPLPAHSTANQGHVSSAAAIATRNQQAGPHRCDRINPTTSKPCNSVFSRPYDLTRHEDTIHSGRKQKVRCHLCTEEKTFSRSDALTRHMRVVHPEVDWPGKTRRKGRD